MDWETLETDLSCIDIENSTYRITTDQSIEPLAASIGAMGLLNPPFLTTTDDRKYVVVSGFKRVAACLQLGHANIRAHLLNPGCSPAQIAELAICDNASQRPLNLVETSRSLNLLARHMGDPLKHEQACRRLGLPEHPSMREKIMRVGLMPVAVQEGILEGAISLNTALTLDDMDAEVGVNLAGMFRDLHLSHSKQREILTNLDDIARRDRVAARTLLEDPQLQALLSDPETSRSQKANMVRHHFRSKRLPFLTFTEEVFQKESKKLTLGDTIRLQVPSGFESREYVFTIGIKDLSDLEKSIKSLQNALNNPALKNILTLKSIRTE